MGKHRDHRDQRRRRFDDDSGSFMEQPPEPSYFQRPQAAPRPSAGPTETFDGEVLWFNATKGFGFVKLSDGTEVYLHIRVLEAAGSRGVSEGTKLKVAVEESQRGRQVAQVLEISQESAPPAYGHRSAPVSEPQAEIGGTVKWYNSEKGFGFISPDGGDKDVFVHATALGRAGITALAEGQKVFVECAQGKKGLEVRNIRLA
jgi:cold shock protein